MSRGEVPSSIDTSTESAASGSGRFNHHARAPAAASAASTRVIANRRRNFMGAGMIIGRMTTSAPLAGIAPLTHWGVIRARGDDAATFLHSQLTNDFSQLGPNEARLAGYCSAKGRLLASFVAWSTGPDEVLLACHKSVLAPTLKRLSMFVLRAKCKLSDASAEVHLHGLAGQPAEPAIGALAVWTKRDVDGTQLIRMPDAAGVARALLATSADAPAAGPALPLDTWRWLEVQSGIEVIEAASAGPFWPATNKL